MLQLLTLKDKYQHYSLHQILKEYALVITNSVGRIVLVCLLED
jgi:hypothetical protein